ncbi:ATP-binding protein [Chroococcidiopsis sp. CCNUC1]|uniref:AAA family ATPase n=1 Tax=Chroococcidiopsis sp. CCNUC1 TaxID=2653189 RepID=UPI00201FC567|nr:ATP-binding protein [Chroococcidiopsis sp. CCNUC1]URD49549.1 ATP-binding protein [Chroococcidiopsis sp. CCNUC1]
MSTKSTLFFFCGKMAAGKSTLARQIAKEYNAILFVEDELLAQLYPDEIADIPSYIKYSPRLRTAISSHISDLLSREISVVLDFSANTINQRKWFRGLFEKANAAHKLYFINATDDLCKRQLKERSKNQSESAFVSETVFEEITKYFQPPSEEEQFNIVIYDRS